MNSFENEEFWTDLAPLIMFRGAWHRAPGEAALLASRLAKGASVLDMSCGMGRHSIHLAHLGFHVTGVDLSRTYLSLAEEFAKSEGIHVEFVRQDMREFRRVESFDAAISMSTSFGLFKDPLDDLRTAVNIHASLRFGGLLIVDLVGKEILCRSLKDWQSFDCNGKRLTVERSISEGWTWIEETWKVLTNGQTQVFRMSYRPYSAPELKAILGEAGFRDIEILGDLNSASYDVNARRLIAVARK